MKLKMITGIMLTLLMASIVSMGRASLVSVVTQTISKTTIYLNPATINGTAIGVNKTVIVNLMIRDADTIQTWAAGMIFNATLLSCTAFKEGEFLKDGPPPKPTVWQKGSIDNTAGVIGGHSCQLTVTNLTSGSGRLAYLNFTVKAVGVSDLHLRDVSVSSGLFNVPVNIIDIYTVVLDAANHTIFTVSNSTLLTGLYHSGFYAHSYNLALKTLSFNVTGPYPGFSNVTVPGAFMFGPLYEWIVVIDDTSLSPSERIVTQNDTHYFVYFTYSQGKHRIEIIAPYITPEFPMVILAPLLFILTLIAVIQVKMLWSTKRRGRPVARYVAR